MAGMLKERTLVHSLTAKYLPDLSICCVHEGTLTMSVNRSYSIRAAWRTDTFPFFRQVLTLSLIMS